MAMSKEERAEPCRQIGTLGGQATARAYGLEYMRAIAAAGFKTTCEHHYGGNTGYARAALILRRRHLRPRPNQETETTR